MTPCSTIPGRPFDVQGGRVVVRVADVDGAAQVTPGIIR